MPVRFELPREHPGVALVTIDRPERTNALDPETLQALATTWRRIAASPEIRCAVLTGAGDRAFCAGMDMRLTIPAAQRLARGETVTAEQFQGLRSVNTALLAGFDLATCAFRILVRIEMIDVFVALGQRAFDGVPCSSGSFGCDSISAVVSRAAPSGGSRASPPAARPQAPVYREDQLSSAGR